MRFPSDCAERAQVHLARARTLAVRYAKLRLASAVLEREIEDYRRANQDPVLALAERHFQTLTNGSFQELRVVVGDDDAPELVCVRGGQEVAVDGLSDGTKDQLYLALRLATIARHMERARAIPLVLDDILVNFDDDRARSALSVLSRLGPTLQVLLFTHQPRVVELAREVEPERTNVVHLG
jgi:uncharacterized protein YhaN